MDSSLRFIGAGVTSRTPFYSRRPGMRRICPILNVLTRWVALLAGILATVPAPAQVVINEIHYDPDSPSSLTEFVEIHNPSGSDISLSGWYFSSGISYTFPEGSSIAAAGYLAIAENKAHYRANYRADPFGLFQSGSLANEGENLTLRDKEGNKVDEVDYKSEFPWPVTPGGQGPSLELINPGLDNGLGGSWRPCLSSPTPAAQNSVYSADAPPQIRKVSHSPQQPRDFEQPVVQAKVSDTDLVQSVELHYQVVPPGSYFGAFQPKTLSEILNAPLDPHAANPSFEDPANWQILPMARDFAQGESIYTARLPNQPNRTLVRYRIFATDKNGEAARAPQQDDPSLNFAYFVYNGVPEYVASQNSVHPDGAGHTYPRQVMTSLPVYQLITDPAAYAMCYGYNPADRIPKTNKDARSEFHWFGTFVYEGVVYDHIQYRLRQANDRYSQRTGTNGKRSMRFRFNHGHLFHPRDINGNLFPNKVRTINTGKMSDNKGVGNFGITETMNSLLWNMVDVPAPHTWWFHFRVVKTAEEQPDQYNGDFQGFQLVFENYDGTFLKTHRMPDGNLYKLKDQVFDGNLVKRHQGTKSTTGDSDFQNIRNNLRPERSDSWLNIHVNYDKSFRYHTINEAVRHYDVRPADSHSKNRAWFFNPYPGNPLGRLWTLPWDSDASWGPNWGAGIDYSHNAAIVANGGKPDFVRDYKNFIREFRDLLWTEGVINPMVDRLADKIRDFVPADRDRWKDAPASAGSQDYGTMEWKVQDMKEFAFVGWTGSTGPDVPSGGRAGHLDYLSLDLDIPFTPAISYVGDSGQPLDGIILQSSAFNDPQADGTMAAMQWRVAEVGDIEVPELTRGAKPVLEWYANWDSGELPTFSSTVRVPARSLVEGRTYSARVRHKDNTGRWSHWSKAVQFVPGPPISLPTLQQNLAISEVHYDPAPATTEEMLAGYATSDFEFIELKNVGSNALDLSDVRFTKGVDFNFPEGTRLDSGGITLLVANLAAFESRYGPGLPVAGQFKGKLDNAGERIKLYLGAGIAIHEMEYSNNPPWPANAGHSMVLAPLSPGTDHSSPSSWKASLVAGGTPGTDEILGVPSSPILVTEFMALNRDVYPDSDGEFTDWIELHNPGGSTADLTGWALTDDPDEPSRWIFPPGTSLAPGSYLVVFASAKSPSPQGELHAPFKLSSQEGGFLSLTDPNGHMVQMFHNYPTQREGFSYGLANNNGKPRFFDVPTPGQANGDGVAGIVQDTKFSHKRGFFSQPFDLVIGTNTDQATIHYTTDGSLPSDQNGTLYTKPIRIDTTTTLRAIATKPGYVPTNVDTQTYLFPADIVRQPIVPPGFPSTWNGHTADYAMDPEIVDDPRWRTHIEDDLQSVPTLSLVLDRDDFFDATQGIYPKGESVEKPVSAELILPDGQDGFQIDASVQVVGGSSVNRWKTDKLSLRLKFTSEYGPPKLEFPVFGESAAQEFDTLVVDAHLNNVWSYGGSSSPTLQRQRAQYLRDQYVSDLHRQLGGHSPHGYNIHLYIDGLYWGLHTLHERPDENFVRQYRGGSPDDYDVMKHRTSTVVHGTNDSYLALVSAANQDLSVQANYDAVLSMLDLGQFINYMLLNFYLGNTDWGHQNWYASTHRTDPERKWQYHNWDAEHIMEDLNQNATTRDNLGGPTRIHHQLKAHPDYRAIFADLTYKHLFNGGVLSPEKSSAYYAYKAAQIERAIIAESARWGDNQRAQPYTSEDWVAERDNLLQNYFPNRRDVVIQQLRATGAYPTLDPPTFSQRGGEVPIGYSLSLSSQTGDIYYTLDGKDPRSPGGGFDISARRYTQPFTLQGASIQVSARAKSGIEWSAIDQATFLVDPALPTPANLAITEIHYAPKVPTQAETNQGFDASDFEFIELKNTSQHQSLHLDGLRFTDGIDFAFPNGLVLDPGARLILASNLSAFELRHGSTANIAGQYAGKLNNAGETLRLTAPDGSILLDFKYDNQAPWPQAAATGGKSLVLRTSRDPAIATNWHASTVTGGTPGDGEPYEGNDNDSDGLPDDWENTHFASLDQSYLDDPDHDGLPNLLEFAFGADPMDPNSKNLPQATISPEGYIQLTWTSPESATYLDFVPESSFDLKAWQTGQTQTLSTQTVDGNTTTTIQGKQIAGMRTSLFLRLRITAP